MQPESETSSFPSERSRESQGVGIIESCLFPAQDHSAKSHSSDRLAFMNWARDSKFAPRVETSKYANSSNRTVIDKMPARGKARSFLIDEMSKQRFV